MRAGAVIRSRSGTRLPSCCGNREARRNAGDPRVQATNVPAFGLPGVRKSHGPRPCVVNLARRELTTGGGACPATKGARPTTADARSPC